MYQDGNVKIFTPSFDFSFHHHFATMTKYKLFHLFYGQYLCICSC